MNPSVCKPLINILPAVALGSLCLVLYVRTLAPGVLGGDAGEVQFVPYILGLMHPTGYPLLTLVGKLWATVVPIGSVAFRMNLLSAVAASVAVLFLYATLQRLVRSSPSAWLAALLLAVSQVYWSQAIVADKYTLNALLLAAVLFTFVRWAGEPTPSRLKVCAFTYGLSLTHHRSMLLLLPSLALYALWREPQGRRDLRYLGPVALFMFLPLLLYLWLPIGASRGLPPGTWQPGSLSGWVNYLLDRGYLQAVQPHLGFWENISAYGRLLVQQFTLYGVGLGFLGLIRQAQRRGSIWLVLALFFLLDSVLASGYRTLRNWLFALPSFIVFSLWIGEGTAWLWSTGEYLSASRKGIGYGIRAATLLSLIGLITLIGARNEALFRRIYRQAYPLDLWRQDLKSGYEARRFAVNSLASAEPAGIIVADWEQATPLWYYQQVEGWRPDITILYPIERWPEAVATGRPTYLTRSLAGIPEPYHLTGIGPLVQIRQTPLLALPAGSTPSNLNWGGQIALVGYRVYEPTDPSEHLLSFSLYFEALQPLTEAYAFSVRLFDAEGTQRWAEDRRHLALGMYPTARWHPGELVGEYFEAPLSPDAGAGPHHLGIIVYAPQSDGGWVNLPLEDGGGDIGYFATVEGLRP